MRTRDLIIALAVGIWFLLAAGPAVAAYFPSPDPTGEYDVLYGEIFGGFFPIGSEVAAWDQGGTLRFRADVGSQNNFFSFASFWGPPDGSINPQDFTWQVWDTSSVYTATVTDGVDYPTTWVNYVGGNPGGVFALNLQRGDPPDPPTVIPEPATVLVIALLAGSGAVAGIRKRFHRPS